jgi:DNA topoisomerase-2
VEKCDNQIKVENLRKSELIKLLTDRGYQSDPIKRWKERITKERGYLHDSVGGEANRQSAAIEEQDEAETNKNQDFNYLLAMPLWNLTLEKKEEILKQQRQKGSELRALQTKTPEQLWLDDLAEFKAELEKFEQREREEMEISIKKNIAKTAKASGVSSSSSKTIKYEYLPADDGERVLPKIDAQLLQKTEQQRLAQKVKKEENALNIVEMISSEASELSAEQKLQLTQIAANLANPNRAKPVSGGAGGGAKQNGTPKKPSADIKKEKTDDGDENGHEENGGDVSIEKLVCSTFYNTG